MKQKPLLAVYPGSFDPITYGHIDIIQRAVRVFPDLIVAIVGNPQKKTLFSYEERIEMIKNACPSVRIETFSGLLVDYVESIGAGVVIRGLRAISDFEYEFQMALSNAKMKPDIETLFMMSSEQYSYVSSRLIKEIAMLGGDVSEFVPEYVVKKLSEKLRLCN
ncbi:MAG: pantetheine-phosphate adenylyltransferase [Candidatus Auribacterota bacterium]|jgi:pantetheine-phosphate adenylyltransferase|nr:pantetheine-phosphate adenylyltransferase [Candidatus Auribacterota bacterium]